MTKEAFEELEKIYHKIVKLMPDEFNSHQFILKLAQKYQKLYVQALYVYKDNNQPFQSVHKEIAKRLKKHKKLVSYVKSRPSPNIFGLKNKAAVWQKVK